jgi:hypothetical protein
MKIDANIICLVILAAAFPAAAEQTCNKVPAGWNPEAYAKSGSLCADVLLKSDEDGIRKLRVFASGKLAFESDDTALCKSCGGVKGDPFQGIEWNGETLSVSNWGGSRYTWDETWKIAKKHNQWKLIGWEHGTMDGLTLSTWTESVNTLTRKAIAIFQPSETAGCDEVADKTKDCINGKPKTKTLKCNIKIDSTISEISQISKLREKPFACGLKMP